jgi:plasmid stability protein
MVAGAVAHQLDDIVISRVAERDSMAQFVVRDLEDTVKKGLQRRAKRHGRSMEDEVRHILRNAVKDDRRAVRKLGSSVAARFKSAGLAADLPELRGQPVRIPEFDE